MKKIYIIPIEPIDTRYTRQWYDHIPTTLEKKAKDLGKEHNVVIVDGDQVPAIPSPGAFLDFGATNIYKSAQLSAIANEFHTNKVNPGDKFLFTDAWNPTVVSVKYMSELLNIPVEIHGMWHAGSYDPQDFLGRLIGDKPWVRHMEKSMFDCYDTNWFATNFHLDMFISELFRPFDDSFKHSLVGKRKVDLTGWPMDYLTEILKPYSKLKKKQSIVFPHRIAPEKQLNIFKDLEKQMPQYKWIVCQESKLTKDEYHTILGESTMVFSANQQETYGISMIEGLICNSIPLVPDRLSYHEMYLDAFKYPSEWTDNWGSYMSNAGKLVSKIGNIMENSKSDRIINSMSSQLMKLDSYIKADNLFDALVK